MPSETNRILTTHVGSLVRPAELIGYIRAQIGRTSYDEAAYAKCLTDSVATVVKRQVGTGLDIVSDGEFGKPHWFRYATQRLGGIEPRPVLGRKPRLFAGRDRDRFPDFYDEYDKTLDYGAPIVDWIVTGPLTYKGHDIIKRDIANLKRALPAAGNVQGFLPVVAPASLLPELKDEYYGSEEKMAFALADALREEYRAITDAGLVAQIDDAWLPAMYDRMVPPASHADYLKWAEMCVAALNQAVRDIPERLTRYHICWGSWNGPHTADVPLKELIHLILQLHVGGYSIEGANPRHEHEWRVWEKAKLPAGRKLLPGVISHATNIVEHPELVAQRLVRLAKLIGRENVIGSTDCGFAQGALYQRVHESIMWAKLAALVEGAALASQELWGTRSAA